MASFAQDKTTDAITIGEYPIKMAIECDELDKAATLTATSTCEGKVTVTKKDSEASGGCSGTIIRTWTVNDACGNSKTVEQYITKLDNTMPVIDPVKDMQVVNMNKDVVIPKAMDNCSGEVEVTFKDEMKNVKGQIVSIRTYSASDACGNTAHSTQKLTMSSPD